MRTYQKLLAASAAAMMATAPVIAASPRAGSTNSVVQNAVKARQMIGARYQADQKQKAEGADGIIIGVLAAAAVIGGIIIAADENDEPQS